MDVLDAPKILAKRRKLPPLRPIYDISYYSKRINHDKSEANTNGSKCKANTIFYNPLLVLAKAAAEVEAIEAAEQVEDLSSD